MISWDDVRSDPNAIRVDEYGFVLLKSVYGNDSDIANAARISYGEGTKSLLDDRNLIRYLVRHRHTSPIEQVCATFIIKMPIFVMRQIVRHRTAKLNEYSGRYSVMPDEYYIPQEIRKQSKNNKQGSDGNIDPLIGEDWKQKYIESLIDANTTYEIGLNNDVSREVARMCLPVSQYTCVQWQMDLHNLMHFLKLRLDKHTQEETRKYAEAIYTLVKNKFPIAIEAFEDYSLNSMQLSSMEIECLNLIFKHNYHRVYNNAYEITDDQLAAFGLSKREVSEFKDKLQKLAYE